MRYRAVALSVLCLAFGAWAVPARAQYADQTAGRAVGEKYHVEVGGYFWNPSPNMTIQSEALGIVGSRIDFVKDLGIESARFRQLKVVLRPAKKHKFRFEYTPISYEATGALTADVTFNGIRFPVTLPVATDFKWRAYRFAYEYDFVYLSRGFIGMVLETKYTDVETTLSNVLDTEFVRARAPIPAIGVIGRGYVAPNFSITGEFGAFKLPETIRENYGGKFFDFDLYGTFNFNDHVGAQLGYRSWSVFYRVDEDEGDFKLRGLYFGGAVRF
jgi:hypothetical protein